MSNYKTDCPNCGGNDFYVTPSNGVGYCFHCGYYERDSTSSAKTYKPKSDIESIRNFYKIAARYFHSCMTKVASNYLSSRGIGSDLITKFNLGFIPEDMPQHFDKDLARDSGLYVNGKCVLSDRISFPYLVGNSIVDIRGRSLEPHAEVRYKSPLGSSELRGAVFPYNYNDHGVDHIVTEGEIKSIISSSRGVPTVGLPGITSWKSMTAGIAVKQVIVFDSNRDKHKRESVFRAIDKLASRLYNPHVAVLPLLGKNEMDLDTFILNGSTQQHQALIKDSLPYNEWAKLQRRSNVY